ncbi:MAG TPA: hypothetical protein VN682_02795 [Terriglobales bacterium]|nr:hypothetical protein [Terriglobales bacterium]
MAEDSKFELAIVETVYSFYQKLLQDSVREPVPLPNDLHLISLGELDRHFPDPLARIRGWLKLLDLAVTPSMLRHSLTAEIDPEIAETLLRYYARKRAATDVDRDKADFVATFLYRNPRVPGQWERHGYTLDGVVPIPPFEIALIEILADAEAPEMPEEYVPILREFDLLREELDSYTTLEALTDAGVVQKGRDLKQAFGTCFYHPGVLATIGPYNAAIGKKLEELFRATTQQLKNFAEEVHKEGGDVTSPVEGKVTVQHLAMIEEGEILKADYASGQEKFRRVSKVKKAVDQRKSGKAAHGKKREENAAEVAPAQHTRDKHGLASPPAGEFEERNEPKRTPVPPRFLGNPAPQMPKFDVPPSAAASAPATPKGLPARGFVGGQAAAAEPAKLYDAQLEEGKLRSVDDSIRVFVKAAEAKSRQVVPMRSFNLTLSPVEADACGAEYWDEKSFRGEYARALSRIVALIARMSTELEELRQKQNSAHLWKPHASSMRFLLDASNAAFDQSTSVLSLAGQRGLNEKINAMKESLQKLRTRMENAEQLMKELEIRNQQ